MGPFNGPTIAILVILAILLFGAKKLPDLARSLGRSARILKAESKGLVDDDNETKGEGEPQAQQPQQPQQQAGQPNQPQADNQQAQQQGYPQLPPGQRIVNESGEPTNQTYNK
ncbi:Sec-independent protein translocase subunit TatA [Nocardiopsis exhalans]|uniref:Sec-independent protein translocase protein TatA n=1 Tax=Nocardiopsis exhalans TaxID=163604 RepID=A0ABY5DFQ4_9ACTN|nr:Sec-independent protein translocase subunit TatA [Nocardiopsis exhalans]USY22596.1 Sec-independent protein translocase subunit TatA [Nocardiopsis exhalans]